MAPPKEITPKIYVFENKLRDYLVATGLHEHITESLVAVDEHKKDQVILENALTSDKSALRTDLQAGLGKVVNNYLKHGAEEVGVFEIGRTYHVRGDKSNYENYDEIRSLQVTYKNPSLDPLENSKQLRKIFASLMQNLGINNYVFQKTERGVRIEVEGEKVGHLDICCFCLLTEELLKHSSQSKRVMSELTTYTKEALSLILDLNQTLGPIFNDIRSFDKAIANVEIKEEYVGKEIEDNKKSVLVEMLYKTSDTKNIRQKLIKHLTSTHKIEVRS